MSSPWRVMPGSVDGGESRENLFLLFGREVLVRDQKEDLIFGVIGLGDRGPTHLGMGGGTAQLVGGAGGNSF